MLPMSEINVGDVFSTPMFRDGPCPGCKWVVLDKKDGLVKMQSCSAEGKTIMAPSWFPPTRRVFSEAWREDVEVKP